jgi:hypothetical protein
VNRIADFASRGNAEPCLGDGVTGGGGKKKKKEIPGMVFPALIIACQIFSAIFDPVPASEC